MTNDDQIRLRILLAAHPLLTIFGYGEYGKPLLATTEGREELLKATAEIDMARAWLRTQERRETLNHNHSSYGLKHLAESAMDGYISNGAFIAAALLDGWIVRRIDDSSPNVRLNIRERTVRNSGEIHP